MKRAIGAYLAAAALLALFIIVVPEPASASLCQAAWVTKSTTTWGFTYGPNGQNWQVWWSGKIIVREFINGNCDTTKILLVFTGDSGATLIIAGVNVFASFTVQHPTGFTDYANVGANARGRITTSNPGVGTYSGYTVSKIAWANGDEYKLISTTSASKTITGQYIYFDLPVPTYLGATVYVEIHAGPGLLSQTKTIYIPT